MASPSWKNKLYFGDNLDILREHVGFYSTVATTYSIPRRLHHISAAFRFACFSPHVWDAQGSKR